MSSDEEMAIRGRMMTDFADAKKRLVILNGELSRIGKLVENVGKKVQYPHGYQGINLDKEHWAALDAGKIQELQRDVTETSTKLETLRRGLTELGLL